MGEVYTSVLSLNLWLNVTTTSNYLASYPGLLTTLFVTHSTNAGEGPVKLTTCDDVPGYLVNVWRSGTYLLYSCITAFWNKKHCQNFLISSTQSICGLCLGLEVHSPTYSFFWNVPLLHTSTQCLGTSMHVTSSPSLPPLSTANDKHWGDQAWV